MESESPMTSTFFMVLLKGKAGPGLHTPVFSAKNRCPFGAEASATVQL
jgi:hypothetical protein